MSTTDKSTTSTATTVPEGDELPCVQYGFPDGKGPRREPKLRTAFEPMPDGANTASPVYGLTRDQYERQDRFETGYEVAGEVNSIAQELQDECEADDRVLYPVHIESDEYHEKSPATLIEWFREFVEDWLGVPFHSCRLYFSGRRSIHVHVPRFVSGEDQRKHLKDLANTFCTDKGAALDCGLYDRKRLFRLPGVEHEKTGLRKVEIEPEWDKAHIFREANGTTPDLPGAYADVLQRVFLPREPLDDPLALFRVLDSDKTVLAFEEDEPTIETPLIEQEDYPDNAADAVRWFQYRAKEFSPYSLAEENGRSVAVVTVKGGAFARRDVRDGAALVPAYFHGARGCAGEDFTKADEHAPLQLSTPDYAKWDYETGDHVVIIGGQSRQSRIFRVKPWQARVVGHALTGEDGSRDAALDYLDDEGYDIGSAGSTASTATSCSAPTGATRIWPAREHPQTTAEALQRQAEQKGIETLTHPQRIKIACRHLRQGWQPTWDWFEEQFGSDFKPGVTWRFLSSIVKDFEEYDSIVVPDEPS